MTFCEHAGHPSQNHELVHLAADEFELCSRHNSKQYILCEQLVRLGKKQHLLHRVIVRRIVPSETQHNYISWMENLCNDATRII